MKHASHGGKEGERGGRASRPGERVGYFVRPSAVNLEAAAEKEMGVFYSSLMSLDGGEREI